jgi:hypothetical protein
MPHELALMLARRGMPIADAENPVAVARGAMQVVLGGATADEERMRRAARSVRPPEP